MNNQRRRRLQEALDLLEQAKTIIDECQGEEQDAYDNLPEGIQATERGEKMSEAADAMLEAVSGLDDVLDQIQTAIQ